MFLTAERIHAVLKKAVPLLLLQSLHGAAQADSMGVLKNKQPAFHTLVNAGLLAGASSRALQVQAIPGMQYRTWFVGVGAGLDYYFLRSVPIFCSVRKLFQSPIPLFLYADVGWSLPWVKEDKTITWYTADFAKGSYYDVGAGWEKPLGKKHALLLSAGYSGKKATEVRKTPYDATKLVYNLHRYAIKLGFRL